MACDHEGPRSRFTSMALERDPSFQIEGSVCSSCGLVLVKDFPGTESFRTLQKTMHENSVEHGWWENVSADVVPLKLCLVHSEISEALEVFRRHPDNLHVPVYCLSGKPVGFDSELADAIIRIMDLAEYLEIDLYRAIMEKHAYNLKRAYRHGGKAV